MRTSRSSLTTAALLLGLVATACGGASAPVATAPTPTAVPAAPATPPASVARTPTRLDVRASEYTYEVMPERFDAGPVHVTFENVGKQSHELLFGRLKDGATLDDYRSRLAQGTAGRAVTLLDLLGGPSRARAGDRHEAIFDLRAGTYVIFSAVPVEGAPEVVSKGMYRALAVSPATGPAAPEPEVQLVATVKEGAPIVLSTAVRSGKQIWRMVNGGETTHSLEVLRLAAGKTAADLTKWVADRQGPPPYSAAGGVIGLPPGARAWAVLELAPGDYVAWDGIGVVNPALKSGELFAFTVN